MTLVEVAVALTILAGLTAVGLPALRDFLSSRAVDAHAEELVKALRLGRSEAIKRGLEVTVCAGQNLESGSPSCSASTAWQVGAVTLVDYDANGALGGNDFVIRAFTGAAGVSQVTTTTKSVTLARTGILLLANGAAVADGSTISFVVKPLSGSTRQSRTICLNKQGRVSVSRGEITCA